MPQPQPDKLAERLGLSEVVCSKYPLSPCPGQDSLVTLSECTICTSLFQNPVTLKCGHTFCYLCIQHWSSSYSKKSTLAHPTIPCPMCKSKFTRATFNRNFVAAQLASSIKITCPLFLYLVKNKDAMLPHASCTWTGALGDALTHVKTECQFGTVKCGVPECNISVPRYKLKRHLCSPQFAAKHVAALGKRKRELEQEMQKVETLLRQTENAEA